MSLEDTAGAGRDHLKLMKPNPLWSISMTAATPRVKLR